MASLLAILTACLLAAGGVDDPAPPTGPPGKETPTPAVTPADATELAIVGKSRFGLPEIVLEIGGVRHRIELAATQRSRARGMAGRTAFPRGTGMLFIHPDDAPRRYWMKNCRVDMDIAYLDRRGTVVSIHRMKAEPLRRDTERMAAYEARLPGYPSRRDARYALELPSGEMTRLEIQVGKPIGLPVKALEAHHRLHGAG